MFVASRAIEFPSRSNTLQSEGLHGFSRIAWLMNISLLVQADSTILSFCLQKSYAHPEPQGFSNVFFLFPSPPQKRGKERGAGWALPRPTGTTLFTNMGWGACCQAERRLRSPDQRLHFARQGIPNMLHWLQRMIRGRDFLYARAMG